MTAKEYLRQYGQLKREVLRLIDERQRWVDLATRITPAYSDAPAGGSGGDGKIPAAVERIIGQEEKIDAKVRELMAVLDDIEGKIAGLEDERQREILRRRYIAGQKWEEIAREMHYGYQWVCKLHGRALLKIKEAIKSDIEAIESDTPPVL